MSMIRHEKHISKLKIDKTRRPANGQDALVGNQGSCILQGSCIHRGNPP